MKKYTIIIIFLIIPICFFGQSESLLYDDDGVLFHDSKFKISKTQLKTWKQYETQLLVRIQDSIKYPPLAHESGITGTVLIVFECDSTNRIQIIDNNKAYDQLLRAANNGLSKNKLFIADCLKNRTGIKETYYLPIRFILTESKKKIKIGSIIPITETRVPLVSKGTICIGAGVKINN